MDPNDLRRHYLDRGFPATVADRAVLLLTDYLEFLTSRGCTVESAGIPEIRAFLDVLSQRGDGEREQLLALARAHYLAGNNDIYIYFTRVIERGNIIGNLRSHMEDVLGPERAGKVFSGAAVPDTAAPPETALGFTRRLVESLQAETSPAEAQDALRGNAHGIPAEAFAEDREHFLESESLEGYLSGYHDRSVATLAEHARTGKVWFEQEITDEVVDYVRKHQEVLGGARDGDTVYWTKIPYEPAAWLAETDTDKRRYLACHCPMAREAVKTPGGRFPRVWCNCTAGYIRQRFNAVFDEDTRVELLESVLDGDDRCRFAIHVPPGVRSRFMST
jgi:uncharacterized protein DUF6144